MVSSDDSNFIFQCTIHLDLYSACLLFDTLSSNNP